MHILKYIKTNICNIANIYVYKYVLLDCSSAYVQ
jgi:hypothetical protein